VSSFEELLDTLASVDQQELHYELKKLRAIRAWALDKLCLTYEVGDVVEIASTWHLDLNKSPGWAVYKEALAPGARAKVLRIDFNSVHGYWYTDIALEREWSYVKSVTEEERWWHGPIAETPEGMHSPTPYDQEHYPNGRKHTFAFPATKLLGVNESTELARRL
jgi:hypothetical protein